MVTKYDFFDGECHAQKCHGDYVKDEDYKSLKADRDAQQKRADALAVENAGLKAAGNKMFLSAISLMEDPELRINHLRDVKDWERNETPATDAALAAIEVRGVEKLIESFKKITNSDSLGKTRKRIAMRLIEHAVKFSAELREAK